MCDGASDHIKRFWEFSALWKASLNVVQGFEGFRISPHIDENLRAEIEQVIMAMVRIHKSAESELESLRKVKV